MPLLDGLFGMSSAEAGGSKLFSDANPFSGRSRDSDAKEQHAAVSGKLDAAIEQLLGGASHDGAPVKKGTKRKAASTGETAGQPAGPADAERPLQTSSAAAAGAALAIRRKKKRKQGSGDAAEAAPEGPTTAAQGSAGDESGSAPAGPSGGEKAAEQETAQPRYTQEQLERTVYVGNVPAHLSSKQLKAVFFRCGPIESVRLRNVPVDRESKMPKAHQIKAGKVDAERTSATAYVLFRDAAALPAALDLNMTQLEGRHLRVDRAAAPSNKAGTVQYEPKRTVFVGNLPFDVQEDDLISVFNSGAVEPQLEASVEAVRVVKDRKSCVGKGFAYVLFKHRTAALAALNLNGSECKGRKMRVMRAKASAGGADAKKVDTAGVKGRKGAAKGKPGHGGAAQAIAREFQGLRTKGKVKGVVNGGKAAATSGEGAGKGKPGSGGRANKRPAVAARKAKQLLALGRIAAGEAKAAVKVAANKKARRAKA